MSDIFGELGVEKFLADYWQKRPFLVRGVFKNNFPSFDENDLAGLACEEFAEARLVQGSYARQDWQLEHGPFAESHFAALPETDWTLLVQDVEKHYPPLHEFMERFGFVPSWRLDDLMISFAATGGSVGPHVDQYDVFLVQVSGTKRWQISQSFADDRLADCPLDVLKSFEPEQEWQLEAGDMLYLPPNVAHHGVAMEPGMTWSVGLRAPSAADLYSAMSEYAANLPAGGPRYTDPPIATGIRPGEVDRPAAQQAALMLTGLITDEPAFAQFYTSFMSQFRLAREPANPEPDMDWQDICSELDHGQRLARNPWTRLVWVESEGAAQLFAAGLDIRCSIELAVLLCGAARPSLNPARMSAPDCAALTTLVNAGHLVLVEPDDSASSD